MYEYTDDMDEISGFGGGYEAACRSMVIAGLEYWERRLDDPAGFDPVFKGMKDLFGVLLDDNEDAKALSAAMVAVAPDCTGAMHQATVSHVLFIRGHTWAEYVEQMRERVEEEA